MRQGTQGRVDMKESKRAIAADVDVAVRTHIGGQALMEGVMMRGRYNWAVAVREPSGGIYTEEHDLASGRTKMAWLRWPVVRGCTAFVESLVLGYKALSISAEHAYDWTEDDAAGEAPDLAGEGEGSANAADVADEEKAAAPEPEGEGGPAAASAHMGEGEGAAGQVPQGGNAAGSEREDGGEGADGAPGWAMLASMALGTVLGIAIFIVVPAWLSNLVFGVDAMNTPAWNVFDGLVRVAIFIAYIAAIGQMHDIKRMFAYHGAEHKTIHAFEHGEELTPAACRKYPRLHVRCGTAFMIMVMVVAIFVYTALGAPINALVDLTGVLDGPGRFALVVCTRILLMPLIAGLSYEVSVRWAGRHPEKPLVRLVLWPGMQMQRLTTSEPDDSMLECAIAAMRIVVAREQAEGHIDGEIPGCRQATAPDGEDMGTERQAPPAGRAARQAAFQESGA